MNSQQIIHNTEKQRFEWRQQGLTAYLSYVIIDEHSLAYTHTIVPEQLGGQGIGSKLVKYALDYAQQQQLKIIPSCSFVEVYLQRHPEYANLAI